MADEMTATGAAPTAAQTIRDRTVAVSQNIGDTDKLAVVVVVQADNQIRVSGIGGAKTEIIQALSLGTVLIAKDLQVEAVPPVAVDGQAAAA